MTRKNIKDIVFEFWLDKHINEVEPNAATSSPEAEDQRCSSQDHELFRLRQFGGRLFMLMAMSAMICAGLFHVLLALVEFGKIQFSTQILGGGIIILIVFALTCTGFMVKMFSFNVGSGVSPTGHINEPAVPA